MYEAYLNNKFINVLLLYIMILALFIVLPFFYIWKFINSILLSLRLAENMSGKVVSITGASSGLGELMAYEYAKRGASLAIAAIKEPQSRLQQVANRARELGSPDVFFMFADVSNVDECKAFVDDTIKHFGRLDHLVTNAGIALLNTTDIDVTKYEPVMDINFWGSIYTSHFAIPHLKKTRGKIIVNASSAGILNPPLHGFYGASKAALISFYESLRYEVSPTITITILTLGYIQTNIIKDLGNVLPVMGAEACAKAVVDGVCRGERCITEPKVYKAIFLFKYLCPELVDWFCNIFYHTFTTSYGGRILQFLPNPRIRDTNTWG